MEPTVRVISSYTALGFADERQDTREDKPMNVSFNKDELELILEHIPEGDLKKKIELILDIVDVRNKVYKKTGVFRYEV